MAATKPVSRKKRGRPALPPGEGKRSAVGLRVTAALRKRLERAAETSGRSMSQEAEIRLERSFLEEDAEYKAFGGEDRYRLMKWLALSIQIAEDVTGKNWRRDKETFQMGFAAVTTMIERLTPRSAGELSDEAAERLGKDLGYRLLQKARDLARAEARKNLAQTEE